jgi:hypothetical protein
MFFWSRGCTGELRAAHLSKAASTPPGTESVAASIGPCRSSIGLAPIAA